MNATIEKFGFPTTLLHELEQWVILLRPSQPTLGSLVLAAKSDAADFSALPAPAHAELADATKAIESALRTFVDYEKINYLMLMMVDPNVHFHIIPRYEGIREFGGLVFPDLGWPKFPDLGASQELDAATRDSLIEKLSALMAR